MDAADNDLMCIQHYFTINPNYKKTNNFSNILGILKPLLSNNMLCLNQGESKQNWMKQNENQTKET